ncbi:MAG TPA: PP2C family protein-serine/threonine phosphatase [Acidobacteriota bacterium]|nr:PP2C family protein-serine/threonine phosphatase [Acidobacteriota bacterium]
MKASLSASLLESLLESAQLLHASLELEHLLKHLLRTIMGRRLISKGLIAVSQGRTLRLALVRGAASLQSGDPFDEGAAREAGIDEFHEIEADGEQVGVVGLARGLRPVDESEQAFLDALLGIAASGIRNARSHAETRRLNKDLERRVQDLRTLLEMVQSLTSTLDPEHVARLLALTLAGRWGVSRYFVMAHKQGHPPILRRRGMDPPPFELLEEGLQDVSRAVRASDVPSPKLRKVLADLQAEAVFPLRTSEELLGAVVLGPRLGNLPYDQADLEFGSGLVGQSVVAFENGWHFTETVEKRKMEQELGVAAGIQQDLFPQSLPELKGFETAAYSRPARQVGGDYYDALPLGDPDPESPYLFCVADISGKGVPASLLMANIQATLRALLSTELELVELVTRTSALLYATTPGNKYATAILVQIDPADSRVRCVNAGHNDGILLKADGSCEHWKSTGPPVGLIPNIPFSSASFEMAPGDLLALYSDGVVEAHNSQEEEFGEERFEEVLREQARSPCESILERVYQALDAFAGDQPQHDDITLMLIRRT